MRYLLLRWLAALTCFGVFSLPQTSAAPKPDQSDKPDFNGTWALVRMKVAKSKKGNEWLMIKKKDEASEPGWEVEDFAYSVKTGRTQEEIAADLPSKKTATAKGKKKVSAP